jgi:hypothetical protein
MHHRHTRAWGGILLLAGLIVQSEAATYYVGKPGNDAGACTQSAPCATIQRGARKMRGGDTLVLQAGTYEDGTGCEIPSGTASAPTVIKAASKHQAIIRLRNGGMGIRLGAGCTQHHIVIDGLRITGEGQATGHAIYVDHDASYITIQNTDLGDILGNGTCSPSGAIDFGRAHHITVRGNLIHDLGNNDPPPNPTNCNFTYGTYMPTSDNVWEQNVFRNISAFAIHGYDGGAGQVNRNVIRNNVFCQTGPILVTGRDNTITGNRLYKVGQTVYPWERGKTIMAKEGNTVADNQVMDSDGACNAAGGAPPPPGPKLPRPKNLRILQQP